MTLPVTTFRFVQDVAATVWTVVHNLNTYPVIDVYITADDSTVQKVLPQAITYVDSNTATVTFSIARAGFAMVAG